MKRYLILFSVLGLLVVSGCVAKEKPINVLEQGLTKYSFINDVREILKVDVNAPHDINNILINTKKINVVFDGVSVNDNSYFRVLLTNLLTHFRLYFENNAMKLPMIETFYYLQDENGQWYTSENKTIPKPSFKEPTLWLKGPNTGATETSIEFKDDRNQNIVYLSGTDYKNLTLVGERLSLVIMGINSVDDITKKGFKVAG